MSDGVERHPGIDGDLARRIAHEVRSPLGVIVGGLDEVTGRKDLPPDAVGFLALARRSAGRLERLVERMEWIAGMQAGDFGDSDQTEPLHDVLDRAVREAVAFAGRRGIAVEIDRGDVEARAPGGRAVRQSLQELVHNAIRHARTRVDIRVSAPEGAPQIRIEHDGPALDPELLVVDKSTQHASGLGLGLWLCRRLAHHLGATLRADATGITFELPAGR
jgi:signal transduction histidine kinase